VSVLDFLFPKRCLGCGRIGTYFCLRCRTKIRHIALNEPVCPVCGRLAIDGTTHPVCRTRYVPDGLTSFFHYDGVIRTAVKSIKYRLVSDIAEEIISLIPAVCIEELQKQLPPGNTALLPVPLHRTRQLERGFNQADVLGRQLARHISLPVLPDVLMRIRNTAPQVSMHDRNERRGNMDKAFAVRSGHVVPNGVILLDDVFTTGATMRSAANVLKRNGAKWVWAVTMAR
jgi:competence protein ComFC